MKRKKLQSFIGVSLLFLLLFSCDKEFDKIIMPVYSPIMAIPLMQTSLSMADIIEPGDNIVYDQDGLIHFIYTNDSLTSIEIADLVNIPAQASLDKTYELGNIEVPDFLISQSFDLSTLIDYVDAATKTWFEGADGTSQIVPAFQGISGISSSGIPLFILDNAHIEEGNVQFKFTNNFQFDLIDVSYGMKNDGELTYIAQTTVSTIPANSTVSVNVDISGTDVANPVDLELISFACPGTSDNVLIDLDEELNVEISSQDLVVSSGSTKILEQLISDEDFELDFNVDAGYKITQVDLKNTNLNYSIASDIQTDIKLILELPNTRDKSTDQVISNEIIVSYNGGGAPQQGTIDLSNTSTVFDNPNLFPVSYEIWVLENNSFVPFTSTDEISINISLGTIDYSLIKGLFGKTQFNIDAGQIDFDVDFFNDIEGGFNFDDPELTLTYKNSIGLPIAAIFDLVGEDKDANIQALNYESSPGNDTMYFNSPTVVGEAFEGGIVFDNDNTDIGPLLSLPPVQLNYSGVAVTNTFEPAADNFVTDSSKIILGFEMNIPVSIRLNNLNFQDTLDIDMDDNLGDKINYADIKAVIQNGFPLELDISISLVDSQTSTVLETIDFGSTIASATVDGNGVVTSATTSELSIRVDQDTFDNLQLADEAYIIANASTYNDGQQAVKLYSTYKISISVGLEVKFNLEDE